VYFDRQLHLAAGPRKAMPLSLLALTFPDTLAQLRSIAELERLPDYPTQFAFRTPGRSPPAHASPVERHLWELLRPRTPAPLLRGAQQVGARDIAPARRCRPRDHRGLYAERCHARARPSAGVGSRSCAVRCPHPRDRRAQRAGCTRGGFAGGRSANARTSTWCAKAAVSCSAAALAHDPGIEARAGRWGVLGDRLVEETVAGRRFSGLVQGTLGLARPLIAIGAPVGAYYPEVGAPPRRLVGHPALRRGMPTRWVPSQEWCPSRRHTRQSGRHSRSFESTIRQDVGITLIPSLRSNMLDAHQASLRWPRHAAPARRIRMSRRTSPKSSRRSDRRRLSRRGSGAFHRDGSTARGSRRCIG